MENVGRVCERRVYRDLVWKASSGLGVFKLNTEILGGQTGPEEPCEENVPAQVSPSCFKTGHSGCREVV